LTLLTGTGGDGRSSSVLILALVGAFSGIGFLFLIRRGMRAWVARLPIATGTKAAYAGADNLAYLPFSLSLLLGLGVKVSIPTVYLLVLALAAAQLACLFRPVIDRQVRDRPVRSLFQSFEWMGFLFMVSGMA